MLHADAFSGEFLSYGEFIPAHDLSLLGGAITVLPPLQGDGCRDARPLL